MIMQHPLAAKGIRRESHFFDWNWPNNLIKVSDQLNYYRKFYPSKLLHDNPSLISGESTPSYMLHHQHTIFIIILGRKVKVCTFFMIHSVMRNHFQYLLIIVYLNTS